MNKSKIPVTNLPSSFFYIQKSKIKLELKNNFLSNNLNV